MPPIKRNKQPQWVWQEDFIESIRQHSAILLSFRFVARCPFELLWYLELPHLTPPLKERRTTSDII